MPYRAYVADMYIKITAPSMLFIPILIAKDSERSVISAYESAIYHFFYFLTNVQFMTQIKVMK